MHACYHCCAEARVAFLIQALVQAVRMVACATRILEQLRTSLAARAAGYKAPVRLCCLL